MTNEIKAIEDLLTDNPHPNIISVLSHGSLTHPFNSYFIDMELCQIDLHDYIYGDRVHVMSLLEDDLSGENIVFVCQDSTSLQKFRNTFAIMTHIANGLGHMHSHSLVHRDLKPRNGNFLSQ